MEDSKLCPKCGTRLEPPGDSGGRPRRWCSPGCQRSGEAEMRRVNQVLRKLEKDKSWRQVHSPTRDTSQFDAVIAEWQQKYDRLAGAGERGEE